MVVKNKINGFMEFVRTQGVMGLAIGFILGDKVKAVVTSLFNDIINLFLGVLLGSGGNLKDAKLVLGNIVVTWGNFISTLIDFVIVAAVIYFVIKGLGLDKLDKAKD